MFKLKTYQMIFVVVVVIVLTTSVNAEVPRDINFQGRLTSEDGKPIEDGEYNVVFAIWNSEAEGDRLWSDDYVIMVEGGLFTVTLGPLPDEIFATGISRWLSMDVEGAGEMAPRTQLISTPYTFHALRADSAYHLAGAADCGWIRDNHVVKLKTPGDSVGIGTVTPSAKLDVGGDIKTSDSLIAKNIRIGSLTQDGSLTIRGNDTGGDVMRLSEFSGFGGGRMAIFESDGYTYSHSLEVDVDAGGGGYMSIGGGTDEAFVVDGNFNNSNNPYIGFLGADRSTIFDMSVSGNDAVVLPSSSISNTEIWNEAGVANSTLSAAVTLNTSATTILSRKMSFPSNGYAVVIGTVIYNFWHINPTGDQITIGISETEGVIPSDQDHVRNCPGYLATWNFNDNMTVHAYYSVSAGVHTFYLSGNYIGSYTPHPAVVNNANLTVMFFPTWRGAVFAGSENSNPEQAEIDQNIMEKIEAENEALRLEFESKLAAIKAEIQKQQGQ